MSRITSSNSVMVALVTIEQVAQIFCIISDMFLMSRDYIACYYTKITVNNAFNDNLPPSLSLRLSIPPSVLLSIPPSLPSQNDVGVYDSINPVALNHNIFTTFLKARMTCVSRGNSGELPYYYNQLRKFLHISKVKKN